MNTQRDIVRQVIDYIESNLEGDLDLEKIAASAGYSRFHLNRIFAGETGCTIYKYLQARRLTSAAEKLATTDTPIAQIACESGYSSQQAFSLPLNGSISVPQRSTVTGVFSSQGRTGSPFAPHPGCVSCPHRPGRHNGEDCSMSAIPIVVEQTGRGERSYDIYSRLLSDRIIFLGEEVNDTSASLIIAELLFLEAQDPQKDVQLYINSPGGSVTAGFAIYDTMRHIRCDVSTICIGLAPASGPSSWQAEPAANAWRCPTARS